MVGLVYNKFVLCLWISEGKLGTMSKEASSNRQVHIVKGYQIAALFNILLLPLRKPPHHVSILIATTS